MVAPLRPPGPGGVGSIVLPAGAIGEWRHVLTGQTTDLDRVVDVEDALGPLDIGLLERA